jgi:hypothetical protein
VSGFSRDHRRAQAFFVFARLVAATNGRAAATATMTKIVGRRTASDAADADAWLKPRTLRQHTVGWAALLVQLHSQCKRKQAFLGIWQMP